MADDTNPSPLPPNFPGYHSDPPAVPARPVVDPVATAPSESSFSIKDYGAHALRSLLNLLIGAGVGAAIGFILNYVLRFLGYWDGSVWVLTGAGLVVGLFFNRFIVHTLGLAPKREVEVRNAAGKVAVKSADDATQPDGVREIVETVVFVVVLVLMLKSFAAEAFVIPTGSMAETLLGYQKMTVCPQCGYRFPVNCSQEADPSEGPPVRIRGCTCPNCRERITFVPSDRADAETGAVPSPGCNSGDRVLVSKFAYDLFERAPDREDVVVFKYPGDSSFPRTGPFRDGVAMNYIKRLVGLSRETIAIHKGDLYALAPDKGPQYDDLKDVTDPAERAELAKQLWQKKYMHINDSAAVDAFDRGEFQILRKSPDNILAMRRIVYDNDHQASDLVGPKWARWTGRADDPAWKTEDAANSHGFRMTTPADGEVHWLGYRHILRDSNSSRNNGPDDKPSPPQLITDFMGYNTWEPHRLPSQDWVGDLILDCDVQTDAAQGELTLELSKGVDRFRARWDLSTGVCTLLRVQGDKEEKLDSKPTNLKGGTHSVRFANVDERLTVWVDEALPFGVGVTYEAPKMEGATKENDLEPASVGLKGTGATVRGLKLWRDTYYTTGINEHENPGESDAPGVDFADPNTWEPLQHMPTRTMYIQPEHYLCMGDNSPESSDGRTWGAVPKRLLLGKALAVYWPADRFGRIR